MPKGLFSQGICLLTDGRIGIDAIRDALIERGFGVVKEVPAQENWSFSGPSVVVSFLPEVNGYVAVDVVNQKWPDAMGNPNSEPLIFGAWSMGQFGPFAFPGGLTRASQHAWTWPQGKTIPDVHQGFIRLRTSYLFGSNDKLLIRPKVYDPLAELVFLTRMALAILAVPGLICYFNPNGEVLRDRAGFSGIWDACAEQKKIPLLLWMNIRLFNLNEAFGFMDTVGNGQLDIDDVEAIFPKAKYNAAAINHYLGNVTHYLLNLDRPIKTGESIDGPNETGLSWTVELLENGMVQPPRRVMRLYPKTSRDEIQSALAGIGRP